MHYNLDIKKFQNLRLVNKLTIKQCASFLHVSESTIRAWEKGVSQPPFMAIKLLRLNLGEPMGIEWQDWQIRGDTLYTPYGRSFKAHELYYLQNYMSMARLWIKERQNARKVLVEMPIRGIVQKNGKITAIQY